MDKKISLRNRHKNLRGLTHQMKIVLTKLNAQCLNEQKPVLWKAQSKWSKGSAESTSEISNKSNPAIAVCAVTSQATNFLW